MFINATDESGAGRGTGSTAVENAGSAEAVRSCSRIMIDRAILVVWGVLLIGSLLALAVYSQNPGEIGTPEREQVLAIPYSFDRETLIMAIHPQCPCSSASVYELQRLVTRSGSSFDILVLAYEPSTDKDDWSHALMHRIESKLPDSTILVDPDAEMARSLGMRTSGSVVLVSKAGIPLFWGGITASRGHAGDNIGSDAILAILDGGLTNASPTNVYGCSLTSVADCDEMCGEGEFNGR